MTFREVFNFLSGFAVRLRFDRQLAVFQAWHGASFDRSKKLPNLRQLLARMEPAKVMSNREVRAAIIEAATAAGSNVVYLKRGG